MVLKYSRLSKEEEEDVLSCPLQKNNTICVRYNIPNREFVAKIS